MAGVVEFNVKLFGWSIHVQKVEPEGSCSLALDDLDR